MTGNDRHEFVGVLRRHFSWLLITGSYLIVGCAIPQAQYVAPPINTLGIDAPPPTGQLPNATSQPVDATPPSPVVRFQNPNDTYAAGTDDFFRGPMSSSGQPSAGQPSAGPWGQYSSTSNGGSWRGNYPAPSAAPNWNGTIAPGPSSATLWNGNVPANQTAPSWGQAGTAPAPPTYNTAGAVAHPTAYPRSQNVPAQFSTPATPPGSQPVWNPNGVPPTTLNPPTFVPPAVAGPPGLGVPSPLTDIIVNVAEAQTGRLLIGAAVNSDAGVTGQIILDEKNFDWRRVPTGWADLPNAFRGAGQGFRVEALPGSQVQRYMVQFTEPYLFDTRVSFNLSGFLFDRQYFDYDEGRLGGRFGFGYRVTPDLSVQTSVRLAEIDITNPRVPGVPELDDALGTSELYGIRFGITQDTRDIPFAPTQGYYFDLSFEQVLGTFDYSRATLDMRRYFLVTERPDSSGRHVLGFSNRFYITGSQTPIYDNYFAGGYSTLRGFDFRGATPKVAGVAVGGELMILGSVEYRFPVTADDALQAVVFCDYGTVEEAIDIDYDDYRVSLGAGLRVAIPALSAAPIALDIAVPIAREDTDEIQNFAFFVGVSR